MMPVVTGGVRCPQMLQNDTRPGSQSKACVVSVRVPGIVKLTPFELYKPGSVAEASGGADCRKPSR